MSTPGPFGNGHPSRRPWIASWGRLFWITIWTFFLLEPLGSAWQRRDTVAGWAGMVTTLTFLCWYIGSFLIRRTGRLGALSRPRTWPGIGVIAVALALGVLTCVFLGQVGEVTSVYSSVLCVTLIRPPAGLICAVLNGLAWYVAGYVLPGWKPDNQLLLSASAATLAIYGVQQMVSANVRLREANEENQRLAVSDERNRFARDLHDILGHSLTVITVKAELAGRLLDSDPARAKAEVHDLERLSRDALSDVRRAVEGYRELTLPGELARARIALEAAGIDPQLPRSTDEVPSELREVFAWTVREGVTNVIRHSGARTCWIEVGPDKVEVRDDGAGIDPNDAHSVSVGSGSGLAGLRDRAIAVGATLVTRTLAPGFAVSVVTGERD